MRTIIFSIVILLLAGCGAIAANKNSAALMRLNVGDTKERLVEVMGTPAKREVYGTEEYWMYKTAITSTDIGTYTPVLVSNGRVAGWGRNYYDTTRKTKLEADIRLH